MVQKQKKKRAIADAEVHHACYENVAPIYETINSTKTDKQLASLPKTFIETDFKDWCKSNEYFPRYDMYHNYTITITIILLLLINFYSHAIIVFKRDTITLQL